MKINYLFFCLLTFVSITFSSCVKNEALNTEAYILEATIPNGDLLLLNHNSKVNDETLIIFQLKQNIGSNIFAPEFILSNGATIQPESGTPVDFSEGPQKYVVTSQDGSWTKTYYLNFILSDFPTYFAMEDYLLFKGGEVLNEEYDFNKEYPSSYFIDFINYTNNNEVNKVWSSGNQGFAILPASTLKLINPSQYPTTVTMDGYIGKGAVLKTVLTGLTHSMNGWLKTPGIAAGNLFTGKFALNLGKPAASPKFGIPYNTKSKPLALRGYYKYKAGDFFGNKNEFALDNLNKDSWDAYAILFEKTENNNFLDGTHNFKSNKMVMVARIDYTKYPEADSWTSFEASFKEVNGKKFDPTEEYMIAIVFSSSIQGADFRGAIGSTLMVDEVELILEQNK